MQQSPHLSINQHLYAAWAKDHPEAGQDPGFWGWRQAWVEDAFAERVPQYVDYGASRPQRGDWKHSSSDRIRLARESDIFGKKRASNGLVQAASPRTADSGHGLEWPASREAQSRGRECEVPS